MSAPVKSSTRSLRISAAEAKRRYESGQPVLVLDVRSPHAWDQSDLRIQGAVRTPPQGFHIDPSWPKDRFTLAYCT